MNKKLKIVSIAVIPVLLIIIAVVCIPKLGIIKPLESETIETTTTPPITTTPEPTTTVVAETTLAPETTSEVLEQTDSFGSINKPVEDTKTDIEVNDTIQESTSAVEQETTAAKPVETTKPNVQETTAAKPIETTKPTVQETTTVKPVETTTSKPTETTVSKPIETVPNYEGVDLTSDKIVKCKESFKSTFISHIKIMIDLGYPQHIAENVLQMNVYRDPRYTQVLDIIKSKAADQGETITDLQAHFIMFTTDTYLKVPEQLESAYKKWLNSQDPNSPQYVDPNAQTLRDKLYTPGMTEEEYEQAIKEYYKQLYPNGTGIDWNF